MHNDASGFGIYFHWPFCAAKCPYCDFNSHVRRQVDHELWKKALLEDLRFQSQQTERRTVTSIFFGGGTPSLMRPETVGALIDEVGRLWELDSSIEISLEANPTSVESTKFEGFRNAGVSRVSMGIQALNDGDLKALGRMHTSEEALRAYDIARSLFDRVSFDLIYARQNQSLQDWEVELERAISLAVDHLSLYQLTIEAGTRFGELYAARRLRGLPKDELAIDMYELTQSICLQYDLPAYEVSNHARTGSECRHNLTYWRYEPYLGIGPGAHGRHLIGDRYETVSASNPEDWLKQVEDTGTGVTYRQKLDPADQAAEMVLMGMRLTEGVSINRLDDLSAGTLNSRKLTDLINQDYIVEFAGKIVATQKGRRVLNTVIAEMLA